MCRRSQFDFVGPLARVALVGIAAAGCGPSQSPAIPETVRAQLRTALPKPTAVEAQRPILGELMRPGDIRQAAAESLARFGATAVRDLVRILETSDAKGRAEAAWALGRIGPPAAEAVPALIERLQRDDDETVRLESARALGQMGPQGEQAITALAEVLRGDAGP